MGGDNATLHKKEDFLGDVALCYRTDYSDDAKWKRLLDLTDDPNVGNKGRKHEAFSHGLLRSDCIHVIEGRQYENMTAQDLQSIATDVFLIADKQCMEHGTFVLAYNDAIYEEDEETGELEMVGSFLRTTRYLAADILAPIACLIEGADWDTLIGTEH
jgi:hypothetical protein